MLDFVHIDLRLLIEGNKLQMDNNKACPSLSSIFAES